MYAMLGTRPDILYAVTMVSKFSSNPRMAHWNVVKQIYCYLLGSKDLWLTYGGDTKVLVGYADADGSMAEDRCAVSGYAFIVDGGAVSWSTKRQEIVSLSMTKSEYIATTHAVKEVLWLRSLIMQVFGPLTQATTLFSDNQSANRACKKITNTTHAPNILTFDSILFAGSLKMAKSVLYSVLLMTWWQILLQRPSPHLKSSTLLPNSDCTTLEGECWNSKCCQPDTSTSVHLYIDGFSCRYQLMPLAGMFVPVILFHDHMILFSDSPLISLPSFLHDSLTT